MKSRLPTALAAAALAMALAAPAQAGRSCDAAPADAQKVLQGLELAARTAAALDASGAQVVVLARAGQDLSRYGLRYRHLGLASRDAEGWRVLHKLNQCDSTRADLWRQGLAEFFLDDPYELRTGWVVPAGAVQEALLPVLRNNERSSIMHTVDYNMLAYPWAQRYQQSNQWALETLAAAVEPQASSRERAQAWLQFKGYQPTVLKLGAMTRLGARMTRASIAFDDHPNDKRFADRIETVTVDSVFDWLQRSGLGQPLQELR